MKKRTTSKTSRVSRTDWKRVDKLRDKDIDYSDIPRLSAEDFARGVVRWGTGERVSKEQITLRLDADVLRWFRALGKGYQSQINMLLRAYMDAHHGKRTARRG
ncbi:MAG: BrnA antitoxin family protein [Gammaproteobacteria bacterium]